MRRDSPHSEEADFLAGNGTNSFEGLLPGGGEYPTAAENNSIAPSGKVFYPTCHYPSLTPSAHYDPPPLAASASQREADGSSTTREYLNSQLPRVDSFATNGPTDGLPPAHSASFPFVVSPSSWNPQASASNFMGSECDPVSLMDFEWANTRLDFDWNAGPCPNFQWGTLSRMDVDSVIL